MKKTLFFSLLLFPLVVSAQQPVARYTFNNGNANDEIGVNNGLVTGATLTTDRFGNADMAYSFDGIDDYITLGDVSEFQFGSDDFAISIWVEYSATQAATILAKRDGIGSNYQQYNICVLNSVYSGGASQNLWGFSRNSNSQDRLVNGGNLAGAWHHIVLNHRHNDSTSIFVDGQFVAQSSTTYSGTLNVLGDPLVLGYNSEEINNFFSGKIDDIHVYRAALTEQQIDSLYNLPNPATLSLTEVDAQPVISAYPNPASDILVVQMDQMREIAIYSSTGQLIGTHSGAALYRLDISMYASGLYIIKSGSSTKRFLKS